MTQGRFFTKTERWDDELWNVSLLPVVEPRIASPVENLDERRSEAAKHLKWGLEPQDPESISSSFESQQEAIGW